LNKANDEAVEVESIPNCTEANEYEFVNDFFVRWTWKKRICSSLKQQVSFIWKCKKNKDIHNETVKQPHTYGSCVYCRSTNGWVIGV